MKKFAEQQNNMLNIEDLEFRPHKAGFQATAHFENGFGVSIIPEADLEHYEVAILKDNKLCYDTNITKDVLRYQTRDEVHHIALRARNLVRNKVR